MQPFGSGKIVEQYQKGTNYMRRKTEKENLANNREKRMYGEKKLILN